MNKSAIMGIIVVLAVVFAGGAALVNSNDDGVTSSNTSFSPVEKAISRQSMDDVVVLDVRTDAEWDESHATDAVHWGLAEQLEKGNLPPLGKNMEIYVYCRSGNRSGQAIKILQDAGYTNLTNILGLEDWIAAGGEVTR